MAMHPVTGLVYVPTRDGSVSLHAPEEIWKFNPAIWNRGNDPSYEGPLIDKLVAAPAAAGRLVAWDPIAQREVWNVTFPVVESGGVLATGGNLVSQGRSDGIFCAYRATDGKELCEFDAGTGIMAPPVTHLVDGVQYLTLMVGWGRSSWNHQSPGRRADQTGFWPGSQLRHWWQHQTGCSTLRTSRTSCARDPDKRYASHRARGQHPL
jgi:outer membrane protein assembly factor BamB